MRGAAAFVYRGRRTTHCYIIKAPPSKCWRHATVQQWSMLKPDIGRKSRFLPLLGDRLNIAITFGMEKLEWCGYPMAKKIEDMFICFNRIHELDRPVRLFVRPSVRSPLPILRIWYFEYEWTDLNGAFWHLPKSAPHINPLTYLLNYGQCRPFFGRPLGQAYAIGNPSVRPSVRLSVTLVYCGQTA